MANGGLKPWAVARAIAEHPEATVKEMEILGSARCHVLRTRDGQQYLLGCELNPNVVLRLFQLPQAAPEVAPAAEAVAPAATAAPSQAAVQESAGADES